MERNSGRGRYYSGDKVTGENIGGVGMKTVRNGVSLALVVLLGVSLAYSFGKKEQSTAPVAVINGANNSSNVMPSAKANVPKNFSDVGIVDFQAGKYRLAVLPFIGLDREIGEMLAWELGNLEDIRLDFSVVPLTPNMLRFVKEEQQIQRIPNSNSVGASTVGIGVARPEGGPLFDRDYVAVGIVRSIGGQNLLCILILDTRTGQQMAGDYRLFTTPESISNLLPDMAKIIVSAAKRDTRSFPKMAIRPLAVSAPGVTEEDADFLTQLLAASLANNGPYQVYPRTANIELVLTELQNQNPSMVNATKEFSNRQNTEYILGGKIGAISGSNRMYAEITRVDSNILKIGAQVNYDALTDSFSRVAELSMRLIVDNKH
jgi:hypothetical protein